LELPLHAFDERKLRRLKGKDRCRQQASGYSGSLQ
jgi:hypothetical protein